MIFNAMRLIRCTRGIPNPIVVRGPLAEYLEENYVTKKPLSEWKGTRPFVGDISKKLYLQYESHPVLPKIK